MAAAAAAGAAARGLAAAARRGLATGGARGAGVGGSGGGAAGGGGGGGGSGGSAATSLRNISPFGKGGKGAGGAGVPARGPAESAADVARRSAAREAAVADRKLAEGLMFPWERRQILDGDKPLKWWEKAYWVAFAGCMVYLAYRVTVGRGEKKVKEALDEARDARRRDRAGALGLSGESFIDDGEDIFEGLTPAEIQALVEAQQRGAGGTTGAPGAHTPPTAAFLQEPDEFEGLSPEEINRKVRERGGFA